MTLRKYLLDKNIDQIEDDEEFCQEEFETIRDYCNEHMVTEDDVKELNREGMTSISLWRNKNGNEHWEIKGYHQRSSG